MHWILIALIPPFVWSCSNIIDQYICRRYFDGSNLLFVFFFIGCTNLPFALGIPVFAPFVFDIPLSKILTLMLGGQFYMACLYPYFRALQSDDASVAVPIFQTIPVFTFLIGYVVLGETLNTNQMIAGLIIMLAAIGIAWDLEKKSLKIKTLLLMLITSLGFSAYTVFLRVHAPDLHWLVISYWAFAGWTVVGLAGLVVHRPTRQYIARMTRDTRGVMWVWGVLQEGFDNIATCALIMALALAPTAVHVTLVNGLQPFIAILLSGLVGLFVPHYFTPLRANRIFAVKLILCCVMFCGLYILTKVA